MFSGIRVWLGLGSLGVVASLGVRIKGSVNYLSSEETHVLDALLCVLVCLVRTCVFSPARLPKCDFAARENALCRICPYSM